MNFQYPSETSFEDFPNSYAPYKTTSPHTGFSPAMGNQEFSALLEAFTNNPGEDYSSSLFSQQNVPKPAQGNPSSEFNAAWSMADSQASSLNQMESHYSPKSSIVSSESSGMQSTSANSLEHSPYHASTSLYAPPDMYPFSNRPTSQTVPYLEAMAAAPPPTSSSTVFAPSEGYSFDPHNAQMSRQDSTRSFFEGPHLSGLTLDSPRNSISAGSSALRHCLLTARTITYLFTRTSMSSPRPMVFICLLNRTTFLIRTAQSIRFLCPFRLASLEHRQKIYHEMCFSLRFGHMDACPAPD
jgi:hypothetical protein